MTAVKGRGLRVPSHHRPLGSPQTVSGCGQPASAPPTAASPSVALPAGGSATVITTKNPTGGKAQHNPAVVFGLARIG